MTLDEKLQAFRAHQKKLHAYRHALGLLQYDAATSMPSGAAQSMAETLAELSGDIYSLTVDPAWTDLVRDLLAQKDLLDFQTRREAEVLFEELDKLEKVPKEEVVLAEKVGSLANHHWEIAKKTNDYALFKPYLSQLIELKRRYAGYIAPGEDVYDTLLGEFEKGMTQAQMDPFFSAIREKLTPLIHAVAASPHQPEQSFLSGSFDIARQMELSQYLMDVMGIDKTRCMLAQTEHPFTTEFSKYDVRITTKYLEGELTSNLFSVVHESGHAMYELSIADDLAYSVCGEGASMAVHESQSRLWENNIARSLPFCRLIYPKVQALFPAQFSGVSDTAFWAAINAAKPSLVRTEADELTYSLHVLVRYELEKQLMGGSLSVDELPEAWNGLYKQYLGVDVPNDTLGVLQDSHWSGGAFGYFPSYALGSAYAAQMFHTLSRQLDLSACASAGDFAPVRAWLTEKIYRHGKLYTASELLQQTCGEPFDASYYVNYLTDKYTALYQL